MLDQALAIYRGSFRPSKQQPKPYALIGVNIIAADTDAEAKYLATTQQMSFANLVRGQRKLTQPPIDDIDTYWTPQEKAQASHMLSFSIVGSAETVRTGIIALLERTQADELMIVSDTYDQDKRRRSVEIIAGVVNEIRAAALMST
jgi:alkanesulfonate monooxygenase SsuD/methylene tetrahydromethanopterin reductase-like flavin-dependent oxidoreductase (luciferase family)